MVVGMVAGASGQDMKKLYFVFLNKGTNKAKLSDDDAKKMQAEHLGNLGKLGETRKGLLAGPLGDSGYIRGIVVLDVKSMEDVKECFKPDPFIQNRYLSMQAWRWAVDAKRIHEPETPFKLEEGQTVILLKGPKYDAGKFARAWLQDAAKLEKSELLAVQGLFEHPGEKLGVAIFLGNDKDQVRRLLDATEAAQAGLASFESHPQFYGKGALGAKKPG